MYKLTSLIMIKGDMWIFLCNMLHPQQEHGCDQEDRSQQAEVLIGS